MAAIVIPVIFIPVNDTEIRAGEIVITEVRFTKGKKFFF